MTFLKELKFGDISSLLKKDDKFGTKSYRPIAILLSASKISEGIMESPSLMVFCHHCYVVSEGIIAPNIHYSDS